jgi:SOS-response transcriptional repressor LexA
MIGAGIFDGDVLVVDRSIEPKHNDVVLARVIHFRRQR